MVAPVTYPMGSESDGPQYVTSQLLGAPNWISSVVSTFDTSNYLMEQLLRNAGDPGPAGFAFQQSQPLFSFDDPAGIAEFGEIPRTAGQVGPVGFARPVTYGRALQLSHEQRFDNLTYFTTTQMEQLMNSHERFWDRLLYHLLYDATQADGVTPLIPRYVAGTASGLSGSAGLWTNASSSQIRTDVLAVVRTIREQTVQGTSPYSDEGGDPFGWDPDTIVMPAGAYTDIQLSQSFTAPYALTPGLNPLLNPGNISLEGLQPMRSIIWPNRSVALVLKKNVIGGYGDRESLHAEGWQPDVRNNRAFINNVVRRSAMFIDNPLAACFITGIA